MSMPFGPGADLLSPRFETVRATAVRLEAWPPSDLPEDDGIAPDPLGRLLGRRSSPAPGFSVGLLRIDAADGTATMVCDAVVPDHLAALTEARGALRLVLLRTRAAAYLVSAARDDAPLSPPDWAPLLWILERATPADPGLSDAAGHSRRAARAWGRFAYHPPARSRALAVPHALGAASVAAALGLAAAGAPLLGAGAGSAGLALLAAWPTRRWRPSPEDLDAAWRQAAPT